MILLSGLVSPTGLRFSQSFLLEYDRKHARFEGRYAIGHESQESMVELEKELEEEENYIRDKAKEMESSLTSRSPEAEAEMYALETGSQWITIFQRLESDSPLNKEIRNLSVCLDDEGADSFLSQAIYWRRARAFDCENMEGTIPSPLKKSLSRHFAVVPIVTRKSLRALIFVDRRTSNGDGIDRNTLDGLDWFARQGSIALENLELISDLSAAFKELKEMDELKSNFLSIISHELRTPLTAINGFVDLVISEKAGPLHKNQLSLLQRVANNTKHLMTLVNDLIEVAEIEVEGMREVTLEAVDPLEVLLNTIPRLEGRRRSKQLPIEPVISCDVPKIFCNANSLSRIFFHLIDNAIKFTDNEDAVEIHFRMSDDGDTLFMDVIDKGIGIQPENLKRIFDQFYQVESGITRAHEGLGLGLAVTKILVLSTNGIIEVDSEPGKGSRFTVGFPVFREGMTPQHVDENPRLEGLL